MARKVNFILYKFYHKFKKKRQSKNPPLFKKHQRATKATWTRGAEILGEKGKYTYNKMNPKFTFAHSVESFAVFRGREIKRPSRKSQVGPLPSS